MDAIKKTFRSIKYAFRGLWFVIQRELSFRIEIILSILVIGAAIYLDFRKAHLAALLLPVAVVLILELINTVLEHVIDVIEPRLHTYVRIIKDVMAAAVMISAIAALWISWVLFSLYLG